MFTRQSSGPTKSILAADFGSVNTRLMLVDVVDGSYRLVARGQARTTADPPFRDVGEGMRQAIRQMTDLTKRVILTEDGDIILPERPDGSGADAFVATASGGRPMRAVLAGLMPEVSIASGRRAVTGTYTTVVEEMSIADYRSEEQQIAAIHAADPDVILIVGGTDAGAAEPIIDMARMVSLAVGLYPTVDIPRVLFSGNAALRDDVRAIFERIGILEGENLFFADNIRPHLKGENLAPIQEQLNQLYNYYKVGSMGGFNDVAHLSREGILPTAYAFSRMIRYMARRAALSDGGSGQNVLGVDIGSATTMIAAAFGSAAPDQTSVSIQSDLGIGHSAVGMVERVSPRAVARWLPYEVEEGRIVDYAVNKSLKPFTIPQNVRDLEMEMALARESIRTALEMARPAWPEEERGANLLPPFGRIVAAGAVLAGAPTPGHAALVLLDALQPVGNVQLSLDAFALMPALGMMINVEPLAVVQVLDTGVLPSLGSAVGLAGREKFGKKAADIRIRLEDGTDAAQHAIRSGEIWVYPLAAGRRARVRVSPTRGFDLGTGGGKRMDFTMHGGSVGLIFDARGRPLALPSSPDQRAPLYERWMGALNKERADAILS